MAKGANYALKAEEIVIPIAEKMGFELVDVEFVKEGHNYYLRIYIDKEGGVNIDDCEALSKAAEVVFDEKNIIEPAYILEVSSPGLDRPLKKDKDFIRYAGRTVDIKLYKPLDSVKNGAKEFSAELIRLDEEGNIVVADENEEIRLKRTDVATIRLAVIF